MATFGPRGKYNPKAHGARLGCPPALPFPCLLPTYKYSLDSTCCTNSGFPNRLVGGSRGTQGGAGVAQSGLIWGGESLVGHGAGLCLDMAYTIHLRDGGQAMLFPHPTLGRTPAGTFDSSLPGNLWASLRWNEGCLLRDIRAAQGATAPLPR